MSLGGFFSGVSFAVFAGLVLGKVLGVFSFSWLAVRAGIVTLPQNTDWKSFASVCMICGIGFTVSMFIADLSYMGIGENSAMLLSQAKLGVMAGSMISAVIGVISLHMTLPQTRR
jgi:NhaA family Na+:H+ antiporter